MADMANAAKAKTGLTVIDLTRKSPPIDLAHSPPQIDLTHSP